MLTLRKRLFIENYKTCKSATEAAKLAGYSPKSAHAQGCTLLKDVDIAKALKAWEEEELARPREIRNRITQEVYESTAWDRQEKLSDKPELQHKYFELYGKTRGFFQTESNVNVNVLSVLSDELKALSLARKSGRAVGVENIASALSAENSASSDAITTPPQPLTPPASINTPAQDNTHAGASVEASPIVDKPKKKFGRGGRGLSHTPKGGSCESVNPLPNPLAILNPSLSPNNSQPIEPQQDTTDEASSESIN